MLNQQLFSYKLNPNSPFEKKSNKDVVFCVNKW